MLSHIKVVIITLLEVHSCLLCHKHFVSKLLVFHILQVSLMIMAKKQFRADHFAHRLTIAIMNGIIWVSQEKLLLETLTK